MIPFGSLHLIAGFADRTNKHKLILGLSVFGLVAGLIFFPGFTAFILLFALVILLAVLFSPVGVLANNASMFILGDRKDLFGHIRLGDTIGCSILPR